MTADCHVHVWQRPEQVGLVLDDSGRPDRPLAADVSDFAEMSRDVDLSIVLGLQVSNQGLGVPNEFISQFVSSQPDRLVGFAGIDPSDADAMDDLDEAVGRLGLKGVVLSPSCQGIHPMDSRCLEVYEDAVERGLPVVFHTPLLPLRKTVMRFQRPELIDEVAREFPTLRILITSMGYPFVSETVALLEKSENVFADLAGIAVRPSLLYQALIGAEEAGAAGKIFLGSNFPFTVPQTAIEAVYSVNTRLQGTTLPMIPRETLRGIITRDVASALAIPDLARRVGGA
ncbi:MAG: amidohydrolase family protein [Planctomycetia bacterium]|nr:amidohydrolase family protein [Planctomycetia bacterium]